MTGPSVTLRVPAKRKRQSKTLWFNAVIGAAMAAEENFHILKPMLPVNVYGVAVFVLVVGNAALRFYSWQSLRRGLPKLQRGKL